MRKEDRLRGENMARARMAQRRVTEAEERLRKLIETRDEVFFEVHGPQADGYLSYQDISSATNGEISKGRVIQIVQPRYKEAEVV